MTTVPSPDNQAPRPYTPYRPPPFTSGYRRAQFIKKTLQLILMSIIALIIVVPMLWMLSTSFKPKSQLFSRTIDWIPRTITFQNYQNILNNPSTPIARWFGNSLFVSTVHTMVVLVVASLAAYAYGRLEFRGRNFLFGLLLSTLFLPGMMFLVPNFITVHRMGLLDNFAGVLLPSFAAVFPVFFMRQFFMSIPKELEEAAAIDGANPLQIFWLVVLPLAKPALATLAVIQFLASWNDFLWPLLILKDRELQTLQPGLRTLQGAYTSEYGLMMAGAVIVALPVLILYILLQRFIVQSVATTGLKG
jgi:multiple sugar transport system permease protein